MQSSALEFRFTPFANRYGRGKTVARLVRADLTNQQRIRSLMAEDLRGTLAAAGGITHDDLLLIGWSAKQIAAHAQAAIALARRRAGEDA